MNQNVCVLKKVVRFVVKMLKYFSLILILFLIAGCEQTKTPNVITSDVSDNALIQNNVKEFVITAKRFDFVPSIITVNKGDKVKLRIKSVDVTHGFSLSEYEISKTLEPNKEVIVEFLADKKGEFEFRCNNFCGSGHGEMKGVLIVL